MTGRNKIRSLAIAFALLLGHVGANAQTLSVVFSGVYERDATGERVRLRSDPNVLASRGINIDECARADEIDLQFSILTPPTGVTPSTQVDLWRSDGEDCFAASNRMDNGNGARVCEELAVNPSIVSSTSQVQNIHFYVSLAEFVVGTDVCDATSGGALRQIPLFVFANGDLSNEGEIVESDQNKVGSVDVAIDVGRPPRPAVEKTVLRGSKPTLSWERIADSDALQFRIYYREGCGAIPSDAAVGSDVDSSLDTSAEGDSSTDASIDSGVQDSGAVDSGMMDAATDAGAGDGDEVLAALEGYSLLSMTGANVTSATIDASSTGIAEGESATVVVVSVDESQNLSELSDEVCLTRVASVGLCERSGECEPSSCDCKTPMSQGDAFAIASVAFLAFVWRRRKRNND